MDRYIYYKPYKQYKPIKLSEVSSIRYLTNNITYIKLGFNFNFVLSNLPKTITHLYFDDNFNKSIDSLQLPLLTHLTFGQTFNQFIYFLPTSIIHLTFGQNFNQPINFLPSSITYIKFGSLFNQPINSLPSSITHLILGYVFNQSLDFLPVSITHLSIGECFKQPINHLPLNIMEIQFDQFSKFNHKLNCFPFPLSLSSITFGCYYKQEFLNALQEQIPNAKIERQSMFTTVLNL